MAGLQCILVTPETTVFDQSADFVAVPLFDGELGIAPGHSPMIGRLDYGELRIRQGNETRRFYVDGGFVQVADDVVSILTSRAVPAENINPQVARDQLSMARGRTANTPELMAIRDRLELQARAQIRVAQHAGK